MSGYESNDNGKQPVTPAADVEAKREFCILCSEGRSSRFSLRSFLFALPAICLDIFTHGGQVAESVSTRVGSQLLGAPLRLLQDVCFKVPFIGHLVDFVASIVDRTLRCVFNIPLGIMTVIPRLLFELCSRKEAPFAVIVQVLGMLIVQPVVEIVFVVFVVLREIGCLFLLTRSQRVLAQTAAPNAPAGADDDLARVFVNCDREYERDNCKSFFLGLSWKCAHLVCCRDRFTHLVRARNWNDAFEQLSIIVQSGKKIAEVQFVGHGAAGAAFIGSASLDASALRTLSAFHKFVAMRPFPPLGSAVRPIFWFRTCSTLNQTAGRMFAKALSDSFQQLPAGQQQDCPFLRVAGFTKIIAAPNPLLQPGLVVFDPLRESSPSWADDNGTTIGSLTFSPVELMPIYTA